MDMTVILAGTGLGLNEVIETASSAIGKSSVQISTLVNFGWYSELEPFYSYVENFFQVPENLKGKIFVSLQGRYRFASLFVEKVLTRNIDTSDPTLFLERALSETITDLVDSDNAISLKSNFKKFVANEKIIDEYKESFLMARELTLQYHYFGTHYATDNKIALSLVELGIAILFKDYTGVAAHIAEPIVVKALGQFFDSLEGWKLHSSVYARLSAVNYNQPAAGKLVETCLLPMIGEYLSNNLETVFEKFKDHKKLDWLDGAKFLSGTSLHPSLQHANSHTNFLSVLEQPDVTFTFFCPEEPAHVDAFGVLRDKYGKKHAVFIQIKFRERFTQEMAKEALETTDYKNFYTENFDGGDMIQYKERKEKVTKALESNYNIRSGCVRILFSYPAVDFDHYIENNDLVIILNLNTPNFLSPEIVSIIENTKHSHTPDITNIEMINDQVLKFEQKRKRQKLTNEDNNTHIDIES